jgi:Glycosyl hydrolase family 26
VPAAFVLSVATTLAWAWTGGVDQLGLSLGPVGDPTVSLPVLAAPDFPALSDPRRSAPARRSPAGSAAATAATDPTVGRTAPSGPYAASPAGMIAPRVAAPGLAPDPAARGGGACRTGRKLIPTCNVLWGVAPGAHTESRGASALAAFERKTGRTQAIYHAYHGGIRQLFPTEQEIAIARQPGRHRILFLNWKPESASWAAIARGDKRTDAFLDRLAVHIKKTYPEQFFFAVHHEGENDVREKAGSGYTARDYAAMYRHVVKRLRAHGVDNIVTVLVHMAYVKHATKSWFNSMYPGDDVVDWIGFDTYAYSDPGYGHGDFAEVFNRRLDSWPGFYNWALTRHPGKPLMIAEWGVWSSKRNTGYKVDFYRQLGQEIRRFPKIRAMVQFETPHNQKGQDSSVDSTPAALQAYRKLGKLPIFQVAVAP